MKTNTTHDDPPSMSRALFRGWVATQPGRWERIDGQPIRMSPERAIHVRLKLRVVTALDRAIRAAGLPCEAMTDGMTVEIGDDGDYEPDALVRCGQMLPNDAIVATDPVIVVEVSSPGTSAADANAKFAGYLSVPSIRHYLQIQTRRRLVLHHRRTEDGTIISAIVADGTIPLDPPGLTIALADLYDGVDV